MEFPEAIRLALRERLFDYSGGSGRAEYWWYWAFYMGIWFISYFVLIFGVFISVDNAGGPGIFAMVLLILYAAINLALLVPGISLTIRRLHDLDRTGWWIITIFIPILNLFFGIMLLIWFAQPGTEGTNRFGMDPKAHEIF